MQGIILLNKPKDITSFGAVARVRRLCGTKRVGHTGTLDPLAEGVLPILIGRATALSSYITDADKSYRARVRLGITTDTEDITGTVQTEREVNVTEAELLAVVSEFSGKQMQVPPMFSAISRDGVRLYELAREGKVIEREPREIEIKHIEASDFDGRDFTLSVTCSKGTYIRSLCRDIGEKLGCGAVMTELLRTSTAGFSIERTVSLSELTEENIEDYILPSDEALPDVEAVFVTEKQAIRFSNGGELDINRLKNAHLTDGQLVRIRYNDVLLGLGKADFATGQLRVQCVINDKDGSDSANGTALVLGTFDGVHIGHRKVLSLASGCKTKTVLTFAVPPAMELSGKRGLIETQKEKEEELKKLGFSVDTLDFSLVRHTQPLEFLEDIKKKYNPKKICCGFNYHFGENGAGDTELLSEFCKENKIELCIAPPVLYDGQKVCSSLIREKIAKGDIKTANSLLGRPFSVSGEVIHGDSRGRTMGFPTVNFSYPGEIVEARHGVYAARCKIGDKYYNTVTYIGNRPTYHIDGCIVETNILNFEGDLYGKTFSIELMDFLREDKKFDSLEELKEQIKEDIKRAQQ